MEKLTFNISGKVSRATLQGREYLVAPMAMLTEGVHNGSGGPLLYSAAECSKAVQSWNMKPIVVYHPSMNGQGVSACDPDILERQQIGMVLNTKWDDKLRAEAWVELDRARVVDKRVVESLEAEQMMEVSTGLFTDNEQSPGTYKGEAYYAIARNHRPDHVAFLPDKVGACSIADGAGLLQTNVSDVSGCKGNVPDPERGGLIMSKELIDVLIANTATAWTEEDRKTLAAVQPEILEKMVPLVPETNEDPVKVPAAALEEPVPETKSTEDPATTTNTDAPSAPLTVEQYVAAAPSEFQSVMRHGLDAYRKEKQACVDAITANGANQFTPDFLMGKELPELQGLASIASHTVQADVPPAVVPMFAGASTPAGPVGNDGDEEPLLPPVMNWGEEATQ